MSLVCVCGVWCVFVCALARATRARARAKAGRALVLARGVVARRRADGADGVVEARAAADRDLAERRVLLDVDVVPRLELEQLEEYARGRAPVRAARS